MCGKWLALDVFDFSWSLVNQAGGRSAFCHHEFDIETENTFPLAPLGERGDRKAEGTPRSACCGGEGVRTKLETMS